MSDDGIHSSSGPNIKLFSTLALLEPYVLKPLPEFLIIQELNATTWVVVISAGPGLLKNDESDTFNTWASVAFNGLSKVTYVIELSNTAVFCIDNLRALLAQIPSPTEFFASTLSIEQFSAPSRYINAFPSGLVSSPNLQLEL